MPTSQITAHRTLRPADADLKRLREEFRLKHCVRVSRFVEPALLAKITAQLSAAVFAPRVHGDIGAELCMEQNDCLGLLHFLVNDPAVLRFVEELSDQTGLAGFSGRVYRKMPDSGHFDAWHSDAEPHRRIGMSVNLSTAVYEGSVFEIRECGRTPVTAIANTGPGDAIFFAIAPTLEHRVTPIGGAVPKTAFAGWYGAGRSAP